MNRLAWFLFAAVSFLWGIPYFLIKIAIEDLSPVLVVAGRTAIAAAVLIPVALLRGTLGTLRGNLRVVALISAVHIIGPFLLITYGEQHITSSLTGILIAVEPVVIALLMARAEPLTPLRTAGLLVGFAGVVVLVGVDLGGDRWGLLGAGMVLLAAISYAWATMLVQRRAAHLPPEALTVGTTVTTTIVLAPVSLLALPTEPVGARAWGALAALGVLCTAVALLAFYRLIGIAGSNRAGLVTYFNPVVAVLLGVILLSEPIGVGTIAGFTLVIVGCWLSTRPAGAPGSVTPPSGAPRSVTPPSGTPHGETPNGETEALSVPASPSDRL